MGILPLQFQPGESWQTLGIQGDETVTIELPAELEPSAPVTVRLMAADGASRTFSAIARLDTPVDVEYYRNNGILQTVLNQMA